MFVRTNAHEKAFGMSIYGSVHENLVLIDLLFDCGCIGRVGVYVITGHKLIHQTGVKENGVCK